MERDRDPSDADERGFDRRAYLGLCGVSLGALFGATTVVGDDTESVHMLTIAGDENALSTYEVTVSDRIESADQLALSSTGLVGRSAEDTLLGGARRYYFTGEITHFDVDGPVDVTVDGATVMPQALGQ